MKIETDLCMGCMVKKTYAGECKSCGYDDSGVYLTSYLAPRTLLAERYLIGKLISYNGEGAIYMASDTLDGRKVTIKEYMPDALCTRGKDDEEIKVKPDCVALYKTYLSEFVELNRALQKAQPALRLQTVRDVISAGGTAYVIFDYIIGISLQSYLSNLGGKLPWEKVTDLFPPLLTTLELVHADGILHRGISPSTMLVNGKSELQLIGFGITASRTFGSEINYEVFAGYAPPELYSTSARQGSWTDVYGVAAVLYKTLTGQVPPDAPARLENDALVEPMLINRDIPANVSRVIMRGLALDVGERIQTVGEFTEQIFDNPQPVILDKTEETHVPRPAQNEPFYIKPPARRSPQKGKTPPPKPRPTGKRGKKTSNTSAIVICVMLGLTIIGFATAIILPVVNPDIYNPAGAETETTVTSVTSAVTTAPDTAEAVVTTTFNNEPLYKIPDFTSRPYEVIKGSQSYTFLNITPTYEFNNDFQEGFIFEQDIDPDTEVTSGTVLNVKVSKGPQYIELPDYAGLTLDEYKQVLSALNVKYETRMEHSDELAEGYVIRCNKAVGAEVHVAEGEVVVIFYSGGPQEVIRATTEASEG